MDSQVNQQSTTQEQPIVSPSAASRSSMARLVMVGLLMLLIGLGGGYVLFANKNNDMKPATNEVTQVSPTMMQEEPTVISTTQVPTTTGKTTSPQVNGTGINAIKYTLPATWEGKISDNSLMLSPKTGGGYLSLKVYDYAGTTGRREYYCQVSKVCIDGTTKFTEMNLGNISGYMASGLDNSGGGNEYFGAKGNKFYVISSYNSPSSTDFENNYKAVLNSLIF
jgi:hypothetical protein